MATDNPLRIGYAGTLKGFEPQPSSFRWWQPVLDWLWTFQVQNLDTSTRSGYFLLKGLAHLKERNPEVADEVLLHFWGNISSVNQQQADLWGLGHHVLFEGYTTKAITVDRLSACDVLFLPLESEKNGQRPLFIPGKLYEYLNIGKPILALTGPSDCADILLRSGLGIICDPRDPESIAATLQELVVHREELPKRYAADRDFISKAFSFSAKTKELAGLFDSLLGEIPEHITR